MKQTLLVLLCYCLQMAATAQNTSLAYYFPNEQFNPDIPTPESVLGYQVGDWHVGHTQLVMYLEALAAASPRVTVKTFARSYERRPLILLTITSEENQQNIDPIRQRHLDFMQGEGNDKIGDDQPVVLYQGYTIHGNESSGANAALLYAYYLAASESTEVKNYLNNAIVLLDPCYNPDGMNRFASWVNTHKNKNLTADPQDREYTEAYPRGRTNHYWFDLNRDWLPTQHPESQGRIRNFHEWFPNVLTDHHEMGTHNTFFFQPGIPSRTNPITPKKNQELTGKIAEFHAAALDDIGSLYYAKQSFDDFYYGKGSTYPDVKGSIGILFEQASSRGHLQESANGLLRFPFTVRNQLLTSISTLKAGVDLRKELLAYQRDFYRSAKEEAGKNNVKGYVFGDDNDPHRANEFIKLLQRHDIEVALSEKDINVYNQNFSKNKSYTVKLDQPQYRLIRAIFEQTKSFPDSLFYDVSAWTLPLAFNLPYAGINGGDLGNQVLAKAKDVLVSTPLTLSEYAYILSWNDYLSPGALYAIQQAGLNTKLANADFQYQNPDGQLLSFKRGSILIPVKNNQEKTPAEIFDIIKKVNAEYLIHITSVASGNTGGINLGSPSFSSLKKPKVLLVVGNGVTSYDAGEVWHLLDQRYNVDITMVETERLNRTSLKRYNVIILPDGNYSGLQNAASIKDWVKAGGTLIAIRRAINWAKNRGIANVKPKKKANGDKPSMIAYSRRSDIVGAQVIGGSIFETQADLTHPLLYGFNREKIPVFHRGTLFLEPGSNPYASPLRYTNDPVMSGYISKPNLESLKNSAALTVNRLGGGAVIAIVPNPNFRAFWYGTNKIFANAIFFGQTINRGAMNAAPTKTKDTK